MIIFNTTNTNSKGALVRLMQDLVDAEPASTTKLSPHIHIYTDAGEMP